ncbi:MAG: DEAD/DEAH box helicase [Christensenellales bacterium]
MNNFFEEINIDKSIVRALRENGITQPTPIQRDVIPLAMQGGDVVGQAPTGTGKTLAFVLPILNSVDRDEDGTQIMVLCPTRELVIQICGVLGDTLKYTEKIRVAGLYGGQNIQRQLMFLRKKPQIVVGTVGRVLDHIDRKTLKLGKIKTLVLDECDEMFDMGFRKDIESIMSTCPKDCQKMLFSATIPAEIKSLIDQRLDSPKYVKATIDGENTPKIEQKYTVVKDSQRVGYLLCLIDEKGYNRVIIFCNTKKRADKLGEALAKKHRNAVVLHGDLKQSQRTAMMKQFREGQVEMLIATDVAARGIDVDDVQAIFNFDPPTTPDFYVHRIGRTARASKGGVAYTFVDGDQTANIPLYQKATNNALQYMEIDGEVDSFTLPKDSSNRLNRECVEANVSRFFVNVGKKDMLDKDTVIKIITTKTNIKIYEITDVKLRDTYGFVEVVKGKEGELKKLEGMTIGKRKLTIEEADKEKMQKPTKDSKSDYKSKKSAKSSKEKGKETRKKNGVDDRGKKKIKGSGKSARDTKSKYPSKKRY